MELRNFEKAGLEFGKQLKKVRRNKGITQYQLADISGISQRMIAYYESHVKRPSLDKIKMLADALGVSTDELIGSQGLSKKQKQQEETSYKIMKKVRIIEKLPVRDQKAIFRLINSLAEKNKIKEG